MTILIKVTDNRKELMLHFGDERIVDFVIGKELQAYNNPANDDLYIDFFTDLEGRFHVLPTGGDTYNQTVWFSPHLFEIVPEFESLTAAELRHLQEIHHAWLKKMTKTHKVMTISDLPEITPTFAEVYVPLLNKLQRMETHLPKS